MERYFDETLNPNGAMTYILNKLESMGTELVHSFDKGKPLRNGFRDPNHSPYTKPKKRKKK